MSLEYLEHEQVVLGSMMIDPECMADVVPIVNVDHFADPRHKVIYRTVIDHMEEMGGFKFDITLYVQSLRESGKLAQAGDTDYLVEIMESQASSASAVYYCELVKAGHEKRAVATLVTEASRTALDPTTDAHELAMTLSGKLEGVFSGKDNNEIKLDSIMDRARELCEGTYVPAISTGYECIDGFIIGYEPGGMTVLAGNPGMGKTALAINSAWRVAKGGDKVGIFSVEMKKEDLIDRLIAMESNRATKYIKECHKIQGYLHETDQKAVMEAAERVVRVAENIWVEDTSGLTVDQIEMRMSDRQRQCDVLFIDHLGELALKGENQAIARADASKRIRNVGRKHGHHTVLVAQLNRMNVNRTDKRPRMSDLEGSGGIEQAANNIILLHREDYYHEGEIGYVNTNEAEIIAAKARGGERGIRELIWHGPTTRLLELHEKM